MMKILFRDIAEMVQGKYGPRCHIDHGRQTITLFEEATGKVFTLELLEKKFSGSRG